MTAGWCARTVRAAVFAAVCVLLGALGHTVMSGSSVPWWLLGAAAAGIGCVGWALAARERGLGLIVFVVVVTQGVLHWGFSLAQSAGHQAATVSDAPMAPMGAHSPHMRSTDMSMDMGQARHAGLDLLACLVRCLGGGTQSLGMYAVHLLAALLCGLWLGYGERAACRLMRAVAGWLAAPLRLVLALPALPRRPRVLLRRSRSRWAPPRLHLVHAITPRGPPAGAAVR